ncbi:MAG: hypothetical protein WC438_04315 [Candidatus Pacearchaeota archaeon]
MHHHKSYLGNIAGLGMIRQIDDMIIAGQESINEERLREDVEKEMEREKTHRLNQAYVQKSDSNHIIRLENDSMWTYAYAKTGKYNQITQYSFYKSMLKTMFLNQEISKHMLMHVSPKKIDGQREIDFRYDEFNYGGNLFFKTPEIHSEICFGQGYEIFKDLLELKHNKPKKAWLRLSQNESLAQLL